MTFEQYKKNRLLFSDPYYLDIVERVERQFSMIPTKYIHDAESELPPKLDFGILGESKYLSVPCIVFMSDGTEYGTYVDLSCYYSYQDNQWYFDRIDVCRTLSLREVYRRKPTVLKWVPLKIVCNEDKRTDKSFKYYNNYYEMM